MLANINYCQLLWAYVIDRYYMWPLALYYISKYIGVRITLHRRRLRTDYIKALSQLYTSDGLLGVQLVLVLG